MEVVAEAATGKLAGSENFSIRTSASGQEVVALLEIEDGATLEMAVRLPAGTPLRAAEVECRRRVSKGSFINPFKT